ncbi:MAG: ferredoxin family protein [Anaerolineae bacterium]
MWNVQINAETCEGDGDCVDVCPVTILTMGEVNAQPAAAVTGDTEDCIGCMACVNACPSGSITVAEE